MIPLVDGLSEKFIEEPVTPAISVIMYMCIQFVTRMKNAERGMDLSAARECIEKSSKIVSTATS